MPSNLNEMYYRWRDMLVEKAACYTYLTSKSCVVNNEGRYCYWDSSDTANLKCENADDCLKLPVQLSSDQVCRVKISKCPPKEGGGFIKIENKCEDQIAQIKVCNVFEVQERFQKRKRYDYVPIEYITDQECKHFIPTCTANQRGGSVTRSICGSKIQAACATNNQGEQCFWNGTRCKAKQGAASGCTDRKCANTPKSNNTQVMWEPIFQDQILLFQRQEDSELVYNM